MEHLAQVSGGLQVGEDAALDVVVLHPTHVPARLAAVLHLKLKFNLNLLIFSVLLIFKSVIIIIYESPFYCR